MKRSLLLAVAACSTASSTPKEPAKSDPLADLARTALTSGCDGKVMSPPVPTIATAAVGPPSAGKATSGVALAVYTAHPDDEAFYGGGTMSAVAKHGGRVTVVVMSHGEGGRLLEVENGKVVERRDRSEADVAALRDREFANAVARIGVSGKQLYPATARVDYGWTTSCSEALAHWDKALPGGVRGMLEVIVEDIRARKPRVVITLDPRDDPQASHHGHHKAVGVLAELAARAAADPSYVVRGGAPPHVVATLLTFAPQGVAPDLSLNVGSEARVAMLGEYPSQFQELDDLAKRKVEQFVVRWGNPAVLADLAGF
jgi:LmbE family N-acetylglucosaminyl deacetylase